MGSFGQKGSQINKNQFNEGVGYRLANHNSFEQRLNLINEKSAQNEINSNNGIHSSEDNMKTTKNLYSDNEMTPKALYKSNITYNRRKQSNNCSQNTDKSVIKLNESTEEMTDPTTTQTTKTEIISNDEFEENAENIKEHYLSQNMKKFENTYNSLNLSESQFSTKNPMNEENSGFVDSNVGSEECLENARKIVCHELEGFICDRNDCHKIFRSEEELLLHKQEIHFFSEIKFESEVENISNTSPVIMCSRVDCSERFEENLLRHHMVVAHKECTLVKCLFTDCPQKFIDFKEYMNHLLSHSSEFWSKYYPKIYYDLKVYKKDFKSDNNDSNKCDICGKVFDSKLKVSRHKKFVHIPKPSFKCDFPGCERKFKVASRLNFHNTRCHLKDTKFISNKNESIIN